MTGKTDAAGRPTDRPVLESGDTTEFGKLPPCVDTASTAFKRANAANGETPSPTDSEKCQHDEKAEIARLSALSPVVYDQERKASAKKLGIRTSILDTLVKAAQRDSLVIPEQGQRLELPSPAPWPERVDGAEMLREMVAAIQRYVVAEAGAIEAVALWILHAWTLDAFPISPRLAITSPEKRCGKTTLLDAIARLVPRPLATSNTTSAAVFRAIDAALPTLLIDEADTFLGKNDELRGILNSGHNRSGAHVMRLVGDTFEPRKFSTWAPTAIAMIGELPGTLEDRSISVRLRRRRSDEPLTRFRADRCPEFDLLARKAARWGADHVEDLRKTDPDVPAKLQNRAADNWRPLLAIADAAGGDWPTRARAFAEQFSVVEGASSEGVMLLADIRSIFDEWKGDRLTSQELVSALICMEERPWVECQRGRALTKNGLARLLRPFGIHSQTIRIKPTPPANKPTGYLRAQFDDAFDRYLSPANPDQNVTSSQPAEAAG
jgi:hypothetical protein